MQGQWGAELELVVAVMQAALAPAFPLTAVAGLLNAMTPGWRGPWTGRASCSAAIAMPTTASAFGWAQNLT